MVRSSTSGISSSNIDLTKSGCARLRTIFTRWPVRRTSKITALTRSPTWCDSPGICSLRGSNASLLPSDTMAVPASTRVTVPTTSSPFLALNSLKTVSDSASRIFWIITCLALWAAIRPSVSGSMSSAPCLAVMSPVERSSWTSTPTPGFSSVMPKCRSAAS